MVLLPETRQDLATSERVEDDAVTEDVAMPNVKGITKIADSQLLPSRLCYSGGHTKP